MTVPSLTTGRLRLRDWLDGDLLPFSEINADPRVMEHFPKRLTRAESDEFVSIAREGLAEQRFGWWAVAVKETDTFIGFVGLSIPSFQARFTPCVEIGWRLAFDRWGQGYATEAAEAVLAHAFGVLHLNEVVAFTAKPNRRSRKVMERLGMHRSPGDDFDHPAMPRGHPLRPHVLYRLSRYDHAASRFALTSSG